MKRKVKAGMVLGTAVVCCVLATLGLAQNTKGASYALIVGVRTYDHPSFPELRYTENDAEELAKILDRPGSPYHKNVRVLTCTRGAKDKADKPTAANIQKALKELTKGRTRHDVVLVALAGHGMELQVKHPQNKAGAKGYPYFCPSNAQLNDADYETGKSPTLIHLQELMEELGLCAASSLVLMDACREEKQQGQSRTALKVKKEAVPERVSLLLACQSGERSFESPKVKHGVFFHYVLEGLRGEAKNKKGSVSWGDLTTYVMREVPENVSRIMGGETNQDPHLISNLVGDRLLLPPVVFGAAPPVGGKMAKEIENSIGMKLVYVPAGKFTMGSSKQEQQDVATSLGEKVVLDWLKAEGPQREVEITKGFYMGMYEVTQGEWEKVMGTNPSWFSATGGGKDSVKGMDTTRFPVERVSWQDAQDFLDKLNARAEEKKKGRKYRLPSEAEWEYTARRGYLKESKESDPFSFGKSLSSTQANFYGDTPYGGAAKGPYLGRTCKVGSYAANGLGIHDMHGNVWEWCADWYDKDYYATKELQDPPGPQKGLVRVHRGGSWDDFGLSCRSAYRNWLLPTGRVYYQGFRVLAVPSRQE